MKTSSKGRPDPATLTAQELSELDEFWEAKAKPLRTKLKRMDDDLQKVIANAHQRSEERKRKLLGGMRNEVLAKLDDPVARKLRES